MSQLQVTGEAKIRDIQGPVVANDGVITALDGAASQYVRGDGTLADFPTSSGGGSSVSYYLNSSVSQGTIGGVAYRELSKDPIIGSGTDIAISSNGYVANYITDANDPDVVLVPGGNFNCEFYFSVNNNTGIPTTYAELYKYDGTTFTLLGTSVGVPESINQGTTIAPYYFAIPVATATLALTDRLAIRIYVNVDDRTVTLHTENGHLCQVVTTLSKGMVSLNNLTDQSQFLTTGTSGTNFAIVSSGDTHTFNLPVASDTNTGKLSSTDWSTFNNKVPYTGATESVDLGENTYIGGFVQANGTSVLSGTISLKQNGFIPAATGYATIGSVSAGKLSIYFGESGLKSVELQNDLLTTSRTYDFPDASGTLALTSNLSAYVPYTGATSSVDLGAYTLTGAGIFSNPSGTTSGQINLKIGSSNSSYVGYNSITALSNGVFAFISDISSGAALKDARFDFGSLTNNTTRTYTMPDASGTVALTSNLSSYLPLTGGTLTGALSGTSATFTGSGKFGGDVYNAAILTASGTKSNIGSFNNGILAVIDNNALGTNIGGAIEFRGIYTSAGDFTTSGVISTYKNNATSGDYGYGMQLYTRPNGSSPTVALTLASTGAATFSSSVTAGSTTYQKIGLTFPSTYVSKLGFGLNAGDYGSIQYDESGNELRLNSNYPTGLSTFYTNGSERMRITSGGNVGIGTTSPNAKLNIVNNGINSYCSTVWDNSNSNASLAIGVGGNTVGVSNLQNNAYILNNGTSDLIFGTNGGTERMRITSGGALLVGGTGFAYNSVRQQIWFTGSSTEYGLSIAALNVGNTRFIDFNIGSGSGGQAGSISWNGSIVAYNITSDYRLKQDFKDYNGLDLISKIKTYDFEWKADNSRMFGVVAHELQEVIPYAVNGEKDAKEMQQVDYSKLTPINTKAIQELYELVKEQQGQIEELKELIKNK